MCVRVHVYRRVFLIVIVICISISTVLNKIQHLHSFIEIHLLFF